MIPRLVMAMVVLIALSLLWVSHRLSGKATTVVALQTSLADASGAIRPGTRLRFDLLRENVTTLLDSLAELEAAPAAQIAHILDDPGREAFLRGAIERRGFTLSRTGASALHEIVRARAVYMDYITAIPAYADLLEAAGRVRGPLIELSSRRAMAPWHPSRLAREARAYTPDPEFLAEDAATALPDDKGLALHRAWTEAVDAYETRYYRELVERTIMAVALYRERAVVSAETDTLGRAMFAPILQGHYWMVGYYPQDVVALARLQRIQALDGLYPGVDSLSTALSVWNLPLDLDTPSLHVTLSTDNATATLP